MKIKNAPETPQPPKHLSKRAAAFWHELTAEYVFETADLERLRTACELLGTVDECEAAIKRDGLFQPDRYGASKAHPAVAVARDSRTLLLRALRELNVDVEPPADVRIPRQTRRYG